MSGTENYLLHVKKEYTRLVASGFLIYFVISAVFCVFGYVSFALFAEDFRYAVLSPISFGSITAFLKSVTVSQTPLVIELAVLMVSVFTFLCKWVSGVLCAWRGLSLGCVAYLIGNGAVTGVSEKWALSLSVGFAATVAFVLLAAVSLVYSSTISYLNVAGERRYAVSVLTEYFKYFLVISGVILILGCITVILI